MRPFLMFAAALLVGAPVYAGTAAPGAYDYTEGCFVLNGDTLIAYGTAPIAFPRLILSCGEPANASNFALDPMAGPGDPTTDGGTVEEAGLQLPPGLDMGLAGPDGPGGAFRPADAQILPGDVGQVPEPAAAGLIGLGLTALGIRRYRRVRATR